MAPFKLFIVKNHIIWVMLLSFYHSFLRIDKSQSSKKIINFIAFMTYIV